MTIALDHLTLGRAHLQLAQHAGDNSTLNLELATSNLEHSGGRPAAGGTTDELPRGLLARAELYRVQGEFEKAERDLEEALEIATRGGMRLFEADCYLEIVRLLLAGGPLPRSLPSQGREADAREYLQKAREMIEEMGYGRRLPEVEALERALGV